MFKNGLFKRMTHKEQNTCEAKLLNVMKRLKIEEFDFNWDRSSCFIEFNYQEQSYRLEHSIEKARKRGVLLKNGLDCLIGLTESLEELCGIIERGTYDFETWISGMKQSTSVKETPDSPEEFQRKGNLMGEQIPPEYKRNEQLIPFTPDSSLKNPERKEMSPRALRK